MLHAAPSVEATLTLNAAEFDTDPNTEESLDVSASALTHPPCRGRKFGIAAPLLGLAALLAAAIVIYIQTGEGEVIVESEVDSISLDILRNGEPVKEDWQIHGGADNRWRVRTGTVEVRLPANLEGEFTLDQYTARLVRDGTIVVKITRKKSHEGPAVVTEDRAAAEWVLAQGGTVSYITATGEVPTSSVGDLPATPFQIHTADLWGAKTVQNEDLDRFAGLARLEYCWLDETDLDRDAIPRLARIPTLRGLGVSGTRITSSQLGGLAALPSLNNIGIKAGAQTDDDWTAVRELPALRELTLHEATADDVRRASRLSRLRTIFLPVADDNALPAALEDAVAELQAANPLCRVLVGGGNLVYRAVGRDPESGLARRLLAGRAALSLALAGQGGKATADDLSAGKSVCICSIEMKPEVSLTADDLDHLSCSAATLVEFLAHGATGADRYAAALADNASLANVEFTNSDLSDTGLDHLRRLASLATLDVQGTKVTGAGVQKLHAALPRCRILSDHGTIEPERPTEGK